MVELAEERSAAAWKIRNLEDYDGRLERAAQRFDEISRGRPEPALMVYETALKKSGRSEDEIRGMVREFYETFEDEEEPLTITRASAIMSVEGDGWFFGDENLRVLTGRLLGQFQHRVAQYNYVDEGEVLRRWADGYDTRLFVRRRILGTEPIIGVVGGLDLQLFQHLRVAAGGNTLVPTPEVAAALDSLGYGHSADEYETLGRAEELALRLDLPAPVVGEMLQELGRKGFVDYPEPPREETIRQEEPAEGNVASEGGTVSGGAADEPSEAKPSPAEREERVRTREEPAAGEEPTRVQDPQAKDAPGTTEEEGGVIGAGSAESGSDDQPGTAGRGDS